MAHADVCKMYFWAHVGMLFRKTKEEANIPRWNGKRPRKKRIKINEKKNETKKYFTLLWWLLKLNDKIILKK
jgi:hypothetical protein